MELQKKLKKRFSEMFLQGLQPAHLAEVFSRVDVLEPPLPETLDPGRSKLVLVYDLVQFPVAADIENARTAYESIVATRSSDENGKERSFPNPGIPFVLSLRNGKTAKITRTVYTINTQPLRVGDQEVARVKNDGLQLVQTEISSGDMVYNISKVSSDVEAMVNINKPQIEKPASGTEEQVKLSKRDFISRALMPVSTQPKEEQVSIIAINFNEQLIHLDNGEEMTTEEYVKRLAA